MRRKILTRLREATKERRKAKAGGKNFNTSGGAYMEYGENDDDEERRSDDDDEGEEAGSRKRRRIITRAFGDESSEEAKEEEEEEEKEEETKEEDEEEEPSEQNSQRHLECLSESPRIALRRFLKASWRVWGASWQAQWCF